MSHLCSGHMDKVVLQSQRMLQTTKNYAVGFLEDNKLFVSPVTGIISLQPSFQHYDKADKKVKETNQESNDCKVKIWIYDCNLVNLILFNLSHVFKVTAPEHDQSSTFNSQLRLYIISNSFRDVWRTINAIGLIKKKIVLHTMSLLYARGTAN